MPRVLIPTQRVPKQYVNDILLISFITADPANGHKFIANGRTFIYANGGGVGGTLTVLAANDPYNRTGTNPSLSLSSGSASMVTQIFPVAGWAQPDGFVYVDVTGLIQLAAIEIPEIPDLW